MTEEKDDKPKPIRAAVLMAWYATKTRVLNALSNLIEGAIKRIPFSRGPQ